MTGAILNPDVADNPRSACGCVSRAVSRETPYVNRWHRRIDHRHARMYMYTRTGRTRAGKYSYHCMHVRRRTSRCARGRSSVPIDHGTFERGADTGMRCVWPRCARHVRDYHVARSYLQQSSSSWLIESVCSKSRVAHHRTRVVNRDASPLLSSARAARRCSTSPACCSFSEVIGRTRQVVLQTECYFSGVTAEAEEATMRAMFFEKPVVAATTVSEISVFARPIGKKEPERWLSYSSFVHIRAYTHACTGRTVYPLPRQFFVDFLIRRR